MIKLCGNASSFFAVAANALRPPRHIRAWGEMLLALGLIGILGLFLGPATGLITISHSGHAVPVWGVVLIAFFIPALFEEIVFRMGIPALLGDRLSGDAIGLGLFIVWHPAQVWLSLPMAQPVFLSPAFLVMTALLGGAASLLYRRSSSLWPAVILHWLVVIAWKLAGG